MTTTKFSNCCLILTIALLSSCATREFKGKENLFRISPSVPELGDDIGFQQLLDGLDAQVKFLQSPDAARFKELEFGLRTIRREDYAESLRYALQSARASAKPEETLYQILHDNFDFLEIFGDQKWGDVFMTSYFEPRIPGSKQATPRLTQALYRQPDDMVEIDLSKFAGFSELPRKVLIGRLTDEKNASGQRIINPYYTRKEIDADRSLKNSKLEIVYVDPIDSFFLQIQGSGTVELDDGTLLRVNYAAQNGSKYEAIGAYLRDVIPKESLNSHSIEEYLRSLPFEKAQEIMNKNPSYIFFKQTEAAALTFMGIPAMDGRTMATDSRIFPKGALGFLVFEKPVFNDAHDTVVRGWQPARRFVFDHDKGGAINGPGRMDLFWGRGPIAKQSAGVMKNHATLYYLIPKEDFVLRLPSH